jgi:hypothetical protein
MAFSLMCPSYGVLLGVPHNAADSSHVLNFPKGKKAVATEPPFKLATLPSPGPPHQSVPVIALQPATSVVVNRVVVRRRRNPATPPESRPSRLPRMGG